MDLFLLLWSYAKEGLHPLYTLNYTQTHGYNNNSINSKTTNLLSKEKCKTTINEMWLNYWFFSPSERHCIFLACAIRASSSFSSIIFSVNLPSSDAYAPAWQATISLEISRPEKPSVRCAKSSHFLIKSNVSSLSCLTNGTVIQKKKYR